MNKTLLKIATGVVAATLVMPVSPAVARNDVFANTPVLSGSERTGRIIATGGTRGGIPWGSTQRIECRIEKRFGNMWVNNVFAPGGRRVSFGSTRATVTQGAEYGRFRTRCRKVTINRITYRVVYGAWVQSPAMNVGRW